MPHFTFFVRISLADASCCSTMATGLHFQKVTFCLFDRLPSLCSLMKAGSRSTSVANFRTTTSSSFESKKKSAIRNEVLHSFSSRSFVIGRSDI